MVRSHEYFAMMSMSVSTTIVARRMPFSETSGYACCGWLVLVVAIVVIAVVGVVVVSFGRTCAGFSIFMLYLS